MPEEACGRDSSKRSTELLPEIRSPSPLGYLLHLSPDDHGNNRRTVVLLDFSAVVLVDGFLERPGGPHHIHALVGNLQRAPRRFSGRNLRILAARNIQIEAHFSLGLHGSFALWNASKQQSRRHRGPVFEDGTFLQNAEVKVRLPKQRVRTSAANSCGTVEKCATHEKSVVGSRNHATYSWLDFSTRGASSFTLILVFFFLAAKPITSPA